jgi:putative FmdB family regulatory protein
MPIFEYKCEKCNTKFEKLVNSSEAEVRCEKCGSEKVEKQLSSFSAAVHHTAKNSCSISDCASCCPSGSCGL